MKKKLRILVAIMLIMVMTFGINLEASAVTEPIDTIVERRADLPDIENDDKVKFTGVQAMGVSRSNKNCLYSIKINSDEAGAVMYYFPDISNWKTKVVFSIENVGHANGMTVDTDYIYICASEKEDPKPNPNNRIIRINRDYITSKADEVKKSNETAFATKPLSDELADKYYKVMQPKIVNTTTNELDNYEKGFSTITRAESTGKFIIGTEVEGVNKYEYNGFTRAEIIGGEFVISNNPDAVFLVKNNIVHKYASRQDIHYTQGYGLFIGRWYGGGSNSATSQYCNEANNVILWADIDSDTDEKHNGYKCYTPQKIKIYMDNYKDEDLDVKVYKKFEIESMGITHKGNLIATFNVTYSADYVEKYNQKYSANITASADGIYKITRADGKTFKLS